MKNLIWVVLIPILLVSCVSASSSTGSDSQASVKASVKSNQESASNDMVKVNIDKTIIDRLDKSGNIIERLTIGGGSAETGSSSSQQSDVSTKVDALSKASAEASAKSAFNMTIVFICLGLLIIASVITRIISTLKKFTKPM